MLYSIKSNTTAKFLPTSEVWTGHFASNKVLKDQVVAILRPFCVGLLGFVSIGVLMYANLTTKQAIKQQKSFKMGRL